MQQLRSDRACSFRCRLSPASIRTFRFLGKLLDGRIVPSIDLGFVRNDLGDRRFTGRSSCGCSLLLVIGGSGSAVWRSVRPALLKVYRRSLGHVGAEAFAKGSGIVRINPRILRSAGDGDISEARVDEVPGERWCPCSPRAISSQPLGAVRVTV